MKVEKASLLSSWVTGLFFLGKRTLRATCGFTTLFSWDRAFSYYWMHRFKFSYRKKKKSVLHTLRASSMLSTRDMQICKDQPCYWGVHNSSREHSPVNYSSLCHLVAESDTTEQLNWTELKALLQRYVLEAYGGGGNGTGWVGYHIPEEYKHLTFDTRCHYQLGKQVSEWIKAWLLLLFGIQRNIRMACNVFPTVFDT